MNKIKLSLCFIVIVNLFSCSKTHVQFEYFYFDVKNNTAYDVTMTIFDKEDNTILGQYIVGEQKLKSIDTSVYRVVSEAGRESYTILKGDQRNVPIWNSRSTALNYQFEDFKISLDQTTPGGECDSASLTSGFLCNFVKRVEERKEATETTDLEIHETATFYITNQQFIAADSL